ncbi:MAG TPA: GntR family transcriptional regulator [Thermomicrobiales bacterium]|nr:GntR family transcriptional regulator [Thermomicrobiales bacterium]
MFDERIPIYRQIEDQIKADILSGALAEDQQVMSTNQYAAFYRINPATAAKAFQHLEAEGVLYKRRGIGMFVSPNARERLLAQHRASFFSDVVDPMLATARTIEIPVDDIIDHIRQQAGKDAR